MILAIKKELEAMQMYTQLANLSADTEQKFLFSQLANMESGHKPGSRTFTPTWPSPRSGNPIPCFFSRNFDVTSVSSSRRRVLREPKKLP